MPHTSAGDLRQYVSGQLPAEESKAVQSHLDQCEECQRRLVDIAMDAQWKGPENRGEPRIPVSFQGRLKLLDPVTSVSPPHNLQVIEISRSGLKVRTTRYLIPKTLVQVRFSGKILLGEVRYCVKEEEEYLVGIKVVPDFPSA